MKLLEFRHSLKSNLANKGIVSEIDYIIAMVLNESITKLPLIDVIGVKETKKVDKIIKHRLRHIPLDVIMGSKAFYGREYLVNKNVLSPRPETELLVERAVEYIRGGGTNSVLDLCTGSGCIGITINLETGVQATASDISRKALRLAKKNNKRLGASVKFIKSNMFDSINGQFDLIVSNPPYISSSEIDSLQEEVKRYDPHLSLDGGEDGLDYYRLISENAVDYLTRGGHIILEIGEGQAEDIKKIFSSYTYEGSIVDYNSITRVLIFRRK